jgi:hypothetical protein
LQSKNLTAAIKLPFTNNFFHLHVKLSDKITALLSTVLTAMSLLRNQAKAPDASALRRIFGSHFGR